MERTTRMAPGILDPVMLEQYRQDGFLLMPPGFLPAETLAEIIGAVPGLLEVDSPARVMERDGVTPRSVYGIHQQDGVFADLMRHPALLGAVQQILHNDVYVHQSKVNIKAAFAGDQWDWHQDYIYWLQDDGITRPDLVNVAIFLDDVNEFNGPLTFIPGSHRDGVLTATGRDGMPLGYEDAPQWVATLTADEKFQVSDDVIASMAQRNGMVSPKGPTGCVLFFDPNLLHASTRNMSPGRRAMVILVYNAVDNVPHDVTDPRPQFLAEPDPRALTPLAPNVATRR
ncbi:phytanoyl-CoA dioxygenase family protein [Actinoplanes awajinensis]|nr:phytanoyl-CoA dioxygenase family protein [Actinoplanes awajinensis]